MKDDLQRFVDAQQDNYDVALREITTGTKQTHWMWFVFPQLEGLGTSGTAKYYGIKNLAEASAYLKHPLLGPRLIQISNAVQNIDNRSAQDIFGSPDELKLHSCMTLFAATPKSAVIFKNILEKYFEGNPDHNTLALLGTGDNNALI